MLGKVRPTTSKVLESILATLGPYWADARVLDLFAGSGTLGKAALAAGAREVIFVEGHRKVAEQLPRGHRVIVGSLPGALSRLEGTFDIILGDPPYGVAEGPSTLQRLVPLLNRGGWVVWEHHHKDAYPQKLPNPDPAKPAADPSADLVLWRCRRFGETAISYFRFSSDLD